MKHTVEEKKISFFLLQKQVMRFLKVVIKPLEVSALS